MPSGSTQAKADRGPRSFSSADRALAKVRRFSSGADDLRGIKENVIMGRLIPAGTGLPAYKRLQIVVDDKAQPVHHPAYTRPAPAPMSCAVGEEWALGSVDWGR